MATISLDRQIAEAVARQGGSTVSKLGLRFDRVALAVLESLRASMNEDAREGLAVMLALTAPIRLPGKTTTDLKRDVAALLQTGAAGSERSTILHGNRVELRLVERPLGRGETLLGFVHNADVPAALVLNLAKQWLHAKVRSGTQTV